MKPLPNFFIVGAARSGTTSLDRYLSQHPEIYITPKKETHFFAMQHFPRTGPGDEGLNSRISQDEEQYVRLFAGVTAAQKAIGESSAFYLCFPDVAQRIAHAVPDARIIIILREPAARAYSAYMHLVREGRETVSFEEGLRREEERKQQGYEPMWWYTELGLYAQQVKQYLTVFGPQRVKVVVYEEFYAHPQQALQELFAFLGVRQDVAIDTSVRYNLAGIPKSPGIYALLDHFIYHPSHMESYLKSLIPHTMRLAWASKIIGKLTQAVPVDAQIHEQLKAYFAEDVRKLEELLQCDLSRRWYYRESSIVERA